MQDPQITLKGSNLHIGGLIVTLQTRKKTHQLLAAFLGGEGEVDKDGLRRFVYASREGNSERLRSAQDICLNKLISRTRNFLRESLAETNLSKQFDWLVYSETKKKYELCQKQETPASENAPQTEGIPSGGRKQGILLTGEFTQRLRGFAEEPTVRMTET